MFWPASFYWDRVKEKTNQMEEKFPDFLRDLAEYWKGGLSMTVAVQTLATSEYGALNHEVKKMSDQLSWGVSFGDVIDVCAEREEKLIDETVRDSYLNLNGRGYAHSVECWLDGELAGGLYGVAIGGAFFGESMFSRERDASKVALVALVEHLIKRKFILLDTQWTTPHLKQFGAIDIAKSEYMKLLHEAIAMDVSFV